MLNYTFDLSLTWPVPYNNDALVKAFTGLGDDGSCDCAVGHPMKIVTWNVLANPYAVSESFPKVSPPRARSSKKRKS